MWPLGRRRRLGPRTVESHLRPQGPPFLCCPGGLPSGESCVVGSPRVSPPHWALKLSSTLRQTHRPPPPRCAECSRQRKLCGAFTYLTLGGAESRPGGGLLSRHSRGPLISQAEGAQGEHNHPDPSWTATRLSKAPTPRGGRAPRPPRLAGTSVTGEQTPFPARV